MTAPGVLRGLQLLREGKLNEAAEALSTNLRRNPGDARAHQLLAEILIQRGSAEKAMFHAERAAGLAPDEPAAALTLGKAAALTGRSAAAIATLEGLLARRPRMVEARLLLSALLEADGAWTAAAELCRAGLALEGEHPELMRRLASCLESSGRTAESFALLSRAIAMAPHDSALLVSRASLCAGLAGLGKDQSRPLHEAAAQALAKGAGTPLAPVAPTRGGVATIGFVSGDLGRHSVAYFLLPLLLGLDRSRFRVVCFPTRDRHDSMTERLRQACDGWVSLSGLDDREAATRVRAEGVDVLIDLNGMTSGQRLGVFALRPAPVQATYLGYPNTTGLRAIDWRIVDAISDPPGAEGRCTERLARTEGCFVCFSPVDQEVPIARSLADERPVTFGSFNALSKLNDGVVRVWARVVNEAAGSRLVLKASALGDAGVAADVRARFANEGLAPDRLELLGWVKDRPMAAYNRIDVALDPFPYNGTTTTCEALWMGVPVVTLEGTTHAGRVGASLLRHAGLGELVASSIDDYVRIATGLAQDPGVRAGYHGRVRSRVERTLGDAGAFSERFGAVLEMMLAEHHA